MPTIEQLRVVHDLNEGDIAMPEPDMTYVVYPFDSLGFELPVTHVIRRGEFLYAVSAAGEERCIAGEGAKHAIRGRYVKRAKRPRKQR